MDSNLSLADISSVLNKDNGLGGNAFVLIVVLFLFMFMRNGIPVSGTVEGNSSTYEILQGQQFQSLNDKIDRINNGICDSTFALNNSITSEGRATQLGLAGVNANIDKSTCQITTAIHAEGERTRAMLQQNEMQRLRDELANAKADARMCGVVRYPLASTYNAGANPSVTAVAAATVNRT